jgi:hypothetical protein
VRIRFAPFGKSPLGADEDRKTSICLQCQRRQCEEKAHGRRSIRIDSRKHLVQHAAGKTRPWQMPMDLRYAQGESSRCCRKERSLQFFDRVTKPSDTVVAAKWVAKWGAEWTEWAARALLNLRDAAGFRCGDLAT